MDNENKMLIERFAADLLASNSAVAVQTTDLPKLGYSMEQMMRLIADYKALKESEQRFSFEKGFTSKIDVNSFAIVVRRK